MVYSFAICGFVQVSLYFHKKWTGAMAMSPGVYVTAGKDSRTALFWPLSTVVLIKKLSKQS